MSKKRFSHLRTHCMSLKRAQCLETAKLPPLHGVPRFLGYRGWNHTSIRAFIQFLAEISRALQGPDARV